MRADPGNNSNPNSNSLFGDKLGKSFENTFGNFYTIGTLSKVTLGAN